MTVGDLLDTLAAIDCAREDVDPPMTLEAWRALEITVRGQDEDGSDFCGALQSVGIETGHDDNETEFLALDASNGPEAT